jgi:hypothetical protein
MKRENTANYGLEIGKFFGLINTLEIGKNYLPKKFLMIFWDFKIYSLSLSKIIKYEHRTRVSKLLRKSFR